MRNRFVVAAPAVLAAFAVFLMLALVLRRGVDVPYWDEWEWADLIYAAHRHTLTFEQLWAPHSFHRMFVTKLLVLGLDRLGGWSVVREQVLSLALLAATQLVLWFIVRRTVSAVLQGVTFLVATLLLFGLVQYENFEWGFQFAWFMCNLGAITAVWLLSRRNRGAKELSLAIVAAAAASLSLSQGLAIWAAGLVVIVAVPRYVLRTAVVWCAAGGLITLLARQGVRVLAEPGSGMAAPAFKLTEYILAFFGAPLAGSFGSPYAIAAGVLLAGWLALIGVIAARSRLSSRVRLAPWLAIAAYALVSSILTAAGRGGNATEQALSSRYTTIASLAWLAAVAASAASFRAGRARGELFAAAVMLVLCLSLAQDAAGNVAWNQHAHEMKLARDGIERADVTAIAPLYPDTRRVLQLLDELVQIHDGPFTERR